MESLREKAKARTLMCARLTASSVEVLITCVIGFPESGMIESARAYPSK
jgi:hypothetical protein